MAEILMPKNQKIELKINNYPVQIELAPGRLTTKVGCLGPEGTYTEEARDLILTGDPHKMQKDFLSRNTDVVDKVDKKEYDIGIIPVENLIEGDVIDVWKMLIRTNNTYILAETILPIQHMLIGRPNEEISTILSHEQALGQCTDYISQHYPRATLQKTTSTAKAVEEIINMQNAAAIASKKVAERLKMPIIAKNIGDNPSNSTRFYLIGRGETQPSGDDITTVIIYPQHNRVGILKDYLNVLADNNLNLTNIRSYPTKKQIGEYLFLASFNGHQKDYSVVDALQKIKYEYGASSRILGSYKKSPLPEGSAEPESINGK